MNEVIWKQVFINGVGTKYEVSSTGLVRVTGKSAPMYMPITKKGYVRVMLRINKKPVKFYAHRLILSAFVPNEQNKETVNHKNGNKLDNRVENLEWATIIENIDHAVLNGLAKRGRAKKKYKSIKTEWGSYRPIVDLETGIFYKSCELSKIIGIRRNYINRMLSGERHNSFKRYQYA